MANLIILMILFVDLLLIVRRPFTPQKSRVFWYKIIIGIVYVGNFIAKAFIFSYYDDKKYRVFRGITVIALLVATTVIMILILIDLRRMQTNWQLKRQFSFNYLMFYIIFFISSIPYIVMIDNNWMVELEVQAFNFFHPNDEDKTSFDVKK